MSLRSNITGETYVVRKFAADHLERPEVESVCAYAYTTARANLVSDSCETGTHLRSVDLQVAPYGTVYLTGVCWCESKLAEIARRGQSISNRPTLSGTK
ncbi:hypothetical protein CERSUDRAFT_115507 [Gelatoporia subvermispora B]|uniref:Uncharacterized protein n=1 Tax=Ceriporiopsis subvermispora (strain B) TaxID=914234 RepID=M2RCG5_CERS8|nr:hypothetical protein CERSUDRAFT_115507 [Gelatoporia subvermispora B]